MRTRAGNLLPDERGQVLVMFLFVVAGLFATAALVINAGRWLQAKQLAHGTADAAALAAAQEDPRNFGQGIAAASAAADQNWPGSTCCSASELGRYPGNAGGTRTAEDVSVTVTKDVAALFGGLLTPFGVSTLSVKAGAIGFAASEPVLTINQVSPIALYCDAVCEGVLAPPSGSLAYPWPVDGTGSPVTFEYVVDHPDPADPAGGSSFSPIELPDVTTGYFPTYVTCDPTVAASSDCNQTDATASNDYASSCTASIAALGCYRRLPKFDPSATNQQNAETLRDYLLAAQDTPHLVAIYDDYQPPADPLFDPPLYHVIGWASFSFTVDDSLLASAGILRLQGFFHKLFLDGSHLSNNGFGGGLNDFGVRAVGLTADRFHP